MFQFFRFVQYNISHRCKVKCLSNIFIWFYHQLINSSIDHIFIHICKVIINITAWCLLPSLFLRFLAVLFLLFLRYDISCVYPPLSKLVKRFHIILYSQSPDFSVTASLRRSDRFLQKMFLHNAFSLSFCP